MVFVFLLLTYFTLYDRLHTTNNLTSLQITQFHFFLDYKFLYMGWFFAFYFFIDFILNEDTSGVFQKVYKKPSHKQMCLFWSQF